MMRRLMSAAIPGIMLLAVTVSSLSSSGPPEVIRFPGSSEKPMETPGVYPRIYSGVVEFPHGRHVTDYGATCGDCHHADSFEPDVDLESGAEITNCVECHDSGGLVYGRPIDEAAEEDLLMHRANVMHMRCIGCHEKTSARKKAIVAPIACRGCHAQRQADYELID